MIVEIDKIVNAFVSLLECLDFLAVNAFSFQNGEEILSHSIVIAVSSSWHRGSNAVFFSRVEVCLRGVLEPLVAVELQSPGGHFFCLHSKTDGTEHQIHCLLRSGLIRYNRCHAKVSTTLDIYSHQLAKNDERASEALDGLIFKKKA